MQKNLVSQSTSIIDKPRKKLSFRDPEVMGYQQLKPAEDPVASHRLRDGQAEVIANTSITDSLEDLGLESQAMRIVRTVGQAFEVCHKITLQHTADPLDDQQSEKSSEASSKKEILTEQLSSESGATTEGGGAVTPASETTTPTTVEPEVVIAPTVVRPTQLQPFQTEEDNNEKKLSPVTSGETYSSPLSDPLSMGSDYSSGSLSTQHEMRLLKEQLKHTQAALDQQQILREQLKKETEARIAAQARTHHLLVHNKELLDYIAILVGQIQEMEKKVLTPQTPQMPAFSEPGMVPSVIQESLEEQQRQQQQLSEQQLQPQQQHIQQSSAQQRSPIFQRQFTPDSFLQTNQVNVPNLSPRQPPTMNSDNVYSNLMLQQLGGFAVTPQQQQQQQAASSPDQQQQQQWLLQRLGEIQMSSPLSPQPMPFGKSSELLNQCKLDGTAEDQSLVGQQLQNFGPLQNTVAAQLGALGPDALAALRLVVPMHSQEMQYASILQPPPQGRRAAADQSGGSSNSMSSERVDSASSSAENVRVQEMNRQNLMQQQQLLKQLEQMQVGASPGNPGMVLPQLPRLGNPPIATMGAITRTSSEKVPPHRRDETIAQIQRSAWGRHTTNN